MIKLRDLLNEEFTAVSNKSGKTVVFKNKDARDAAVKAGTHEVPEDEKGGKDEPNGDKPNMFSKDAGYDAPDAKSDEPKSEPSKYDDSSFWKDDEKDDSIGVDSYDNDDGDYYDDEDDDDYSEGPRLTSTRLDKIDKALDDELKLSKRGFSMNRSSGGGGGGFEGPLEITHDDADFDNPEKVAQLSIGSGENNGKFTIGFTNLDGEAIFNDEYSLTDDDFEPQEAYKMAKSIMKMPEVEKLLKGELSIEKFAPIYDKLKGKFNKSSKELGSSSNNNPYNQKADEAEFENALESDGFSWFDGGSLDGVSTFGDESGNTVSVADGSVYDSESPFVVSGFNEDDPVNVESQEFDSKEEALAYAKKLAQKLKSSNEGTIKLMNLLRK